MGWASETENLWVTDRGLAVGGREKRALRVLLCVVSVCGVVGYGAASAVAAAPRVRVGATAPLPRDALVTGSAPSSTALHMTVALEPQDPAGLASFATAVSTPGSPSFRDYLSVSQFAQRFGSTPAHIAAVGSALQAEGLNVGAVTPNDLTIPVTGTAAQVQQALSVSLAAVKLPSGRVAYTNEQAPALPASIAPYVQGVVGLSDVTPDQPAGLSRPSGRSPLPLSRSQSRPQVPTNGGPQPCSAASALQSQGGLTADEIATAYQFSGLYGAGDLGQGQTVALFEQQPYDPKDIAAYQACYSTSVPISNVDVDGGPGPDQSGTTDDGESALDIEQVIGLAPKVNILIYEGPQTSTVDIMSAIVSQDRAKVISSSYGVCESITGATVINAENTLLQEAAAQGQSFFISSGDSGSSMCFQADQNQRQLSVIDPGGQPFATGVGGTTLFSGTDQNPSFYQPGVAGFNTPVQSVWNDGFDGTRASGSGGGISAFFAMPSYQSGAPISLGVLNNASASPCGGQTFCREVPDVSADADPNTGYAVFSTTGGNPPNWGVTGGTSAAAPLWAAFTVLANASGPCRNLSLGFVNPSLYHVAGTTYLNNFSDISQASPENSNEPNNDALGSNNGLYPVGTGYDMATGLGSMIAPQLASSLCSLRAPVYTVSVANPGSAQSVVGQAVALQVHATDSGGAALGFSASGLPAGLSINPSNGVISGVPSVAGTSTVTVSAADGFTNAGSTAFSWRIVKPGKPTSHGSLGGIAKGKAKLAFTVGAGSFAPAIKSVIVSLPSGLSFAKSSKSLAKGIVVKGANGKKVKVTLSVKRGKLTITLKTAVTKATITISAPAIGVSSSLAGKVHKGKVKNLSIGIKATDASHKTTALTLKLKV
jgi:subtilase family serine protease